jgi:hypothetical protein
MADVANVADSEEIEVTPEMMDAGLTHLFRFHPDRGIGAEETVRGIWREMSRCARSDPRPDIQGGR